MGAFHGTQGRLRDKTVKDKNKKRKISTKYTSKIEEKQNGIRPR